MKRKALLIVILCVVLLIIGFVIYLNSDRYEYNSTHFAENTTINGVDCSGLSQEDAKSKIASVWNEKTYIIKKNGETIGSIKLTGSSYDVDQQLEDLLKPNFIKPIVNHLSKDDENYEIKMKFANPEEIDREIKNLQFLNNDYKVKTKNAYVDMSNTKFKIIKEVQGDNVDKEKFSKTVKKDIAKGKFTMQYKEEKYYATPTVKSDSPDLLEEQDFDKKNYSQKITYQVYNGDYVVKPKYLAKMMPADGSGGTSIDENAVKKYVEKVLAWDINTSYAPRKFKSAGGETITVEGGGYGYVINKGKETKKLIEELKSGKDVTRKPIYSQKPYYTGGGMNDIGDTYVEINVSAQELWFFKKGKVKLNTSVVTGNAGNHDTPTGVYQIEYLQRNTVLRGNNDDGTKYNSDVSYWMPFNGGIGCHDASWRGAFGGSIYQGNGSHGCVNMPTYAAAELYYGIEKGVPVVVHY